MFVFDVMVFGVVCVVVDVVVMVGFVYWFQVDVDVFDFVVMLVVDSFDVGGIGVVEFIVLLQGLVLYVVGVFIMVFDFDFDFDGWYVFLLVDVLVDGLCDFGSWVCCDGGGVFG